MKYAVTFESNGIYHGNLAIADTEEQIKDYFKEQSKIRGKIHRLIAVRPATMDDEKPGKPVIYCNRK